MHGFYRTIKAYLERPIEAVSRLHSKGSENVPDEGGVLIVSNHLSWADPFMVGAAIHRPAHFIGKEALFRTPLLGPFLTGMGQIKVDREHGRNEGAIRACARLASAGKVIGIYPEGTRARPGQVKRGKTGVARIAALSGAPVVPVGCDTGAFWPKGRTLPHLGQPVYLSIGAPMHLDVKTEDLHDRAKMQAATDLVMAEVERLYRDCVRAREEGEKWP